MKITKLEDPKPAIKPFVPFTITVETPEEAIALAGACGNTSPTANAHRIVADSRQYGDASPYKNRFGIKGAEALIANNATTKVFHACVDAVE